MNYEISKADSIEIKKTVAEATATTEVQKLLAEDLKKTTTVGSPWFYSA